jgi:hypothetical protein
MRERRGRARGAGLALGAAVALGAGCRGLEAPTQGAVVARVAGQPESVLIGEPVRLRYEVRAPRGHAVAFGARPSDDSSWTWQEWRLGRSARSTAGVHHELLASALPFRTGRQPLPRVLYRVTPPGGMARQAEFPALAVAVGSVLPPDDPRPDIRPERGVVDAPWWTRAPWLWLAAAALVGLLAWWAWRKRPRRAVRPVAVRTPHVAARPAHAVALEALAALRAERLPESGRWYEHQTRLSEILRRFVEARFQTPLPGYTTRELCLHLAWRGLDAGAVERLGALLAAADLAKFARREPSVEVAHRLEDEAEGLLATWAEAAAGSPATGRAAGAGG